MRQLLLPLSLIACLGLVACGGGGSGSSAFVGATSTTSVGGVASKGRIAGGLVVLTTIDGTEVGRATTNALGEYTINLSEDYSEGIVIATLTNPAPAR